MSKMPHYTSTTNACKLCKPLGASLAFRGIEGTVPFLHGSQGCATYMRRYIISHFNEPIDIASSSLGEKHAVYGGGQPQARPAECHQEVCPAAHRRGDHLPDRDHRRRCQDDRQRIRHPQIVSVSTPSYAGTHMEGFHAALQAVAEQLTEPAEPHAAINFLPGFVSAADLRYLKDLLDDFGIVHTLFPDYSESLDGQAQNDYPLIPAGGTPLAEIKKMGGARMTIECGATLPKESAGTSLKRLYGTPLHRTGLPIGLRETDRLMAKLAEVSGREIPSRHGAARGRLVDAMVDGHKYIFGKRAVVYGEEDLVVGLTSFLAEIGIQPVLCASGGKSGRFREAVAEVLAGLPCEMPEVREDADFFDIEELAGSLDIDLLVGHSKGYTFARKQGVPLVRVGFPIHDRMGGQRILHLGYHGAQMLFDTITNTMIARKQDDSDVGYSYM
jgi:nitrogenase molybdenum-iron protein NifN